MSQPSPIITLEQAEINLRAAQAVYRDALKAREAQQRDALLVPAEVMEICKKFNREGLGPSEQTRLVELTLPIMTRLQERASHLCGGQCDGRPCRCDVDLFEILGLD